MPPCQLLCIALLFAADVAAAPLPPAGELVRGIYADPGPAVDDRPWASYGKGYELDQSEKHSGSVAMRCANATATEAHGGSQRVVFNQKQAYPLVIAGWAKLEGVTGAPDYRCSIYLDLQLTDGNAWYMQIAAFDPGKSGWQYAETIAQPPAPIAYASVYVFLRQKAGVAWFDDLYVGQLLPDGTRSENLLRSPGFEPEQRVGSGPREVFFSLLEDIGCNAVHVYRSVAWATAMNPDGPPPPEPDDPFLGFVRVAHERGLKVWVTANLALPNYTDTSSTDFPIYGCVNENWGEAYSRAVLHMTRYEVDGVGVVPDEWNYLSAPIDPLRKHPNPQIAEFYRRLGHWCDCPTCRARFTERYGVPYPDVSQAWTTPDPVWAMFTQFRYDSTRDWIDRTVRMALEARPEVVTDTMICVLPVCLDDRLTTGAAWDQIGATTDLGCLQTDPYIQLHNYLGDSTHLYPTETTLHLGAANYRRRCGVTLEACRHYDYQRSKDPVEVYGSALSCWVHGASEFFWWHLNYLQEPSSFVDPDPVKAGVRSAYQVMQALEPFLAGGQVPGEVLVCYSRRSEDTWDWLSRAGAAERLGGDATRPKRGFIAHRNVLYALLRSGYPFRMTFLEHPDPERLAEARVLLVPFPFALTAQESGLLHDQAVQGKTVILMSELSPVDELGQPLPRPRLGEWFPQPPDLSCAAGTSVQVGAGRLVFLGDDAAVNLLADWPPVRDPRQVVPAPPLSVERVAQLCTLVDGSLGRPGSLLAEPPRQDLEAMLLVSPQAYVLLLTNWDTAQPATCTLRLPIPQREWNVSGQRVLPTDGGKAEPLQARLSDQFSVTLEPQESRLLAFLRQE